MAVDPGQRSDASLPPIGSAALINGDVAVRDSLRMLLEAFEVVVHPFPSAEAFLCAQSPPTIDALVLEQRLPGMNGVEFLATWRPPPKRPRVVLLSFQTDPWLRHEARRLGATAVVKLPSEEAGLIAALGLR